MGACLYPLKDALPIPRKTKKSLKRQMARSNRRRLKKNPDFHLRKSRHKGWYW